MLHADPTSHRGASQQFQHSLAHDILPKSTCMAPARVVAYEEGAIFSAKSNLSCAGTRERQGGVGGC